MCSFVMQVESHAEEMLYGESQSKNRSSSEKAKRVKAYFSTCLSSLSDAQLITVTVHYLACQNIAIRCINGM